MTFKSPASPFLKSQHPFVKWCEKKIKRESSNPGNASLKKPGQEFRPTWNGGRSSSDSRVDCRAEVQAHADYRDGDHRPTWNTGKDFRVGVEVHVGTEMGFNPILTTIQEFRPTSTTVQEFRPTLTTIQEFRPTLTTVQELRLT